MPGEEAVVVVVEEYHVGEGSCNGSRENVFSEKEGFS